MHRSLLTLLAFTACVPSETVEPGLDPGPDLAGLEQPLPSKDVGEEVVRDPGTPRFATSAAVGDDDDGDGYVVPDDCDDEHASIHPDATEVCDGVDNDCDGNIDYDDSLQPWETNVCAGCDTSLDGYAFCTGAGYVQWTTARDNCRAMGTFVASITTAAENSTIAAKGETISGGPAWWIGLNDRAQEGTLVWQSGEAVSYTSWQSGNPKGENHDCVSSDNGSWVNEQCSATRPYICESCGTVAWYDDLDGDGFGDPDTEQFACTQPADTVDVAGDCDDTRGTVYTGAPELCDGLDNDCDGDIDEQPQAYFFDGDNDTYGDPDDVYFTASCSETPPSGYVADGGDCDDDAAAVNPGVTEACNSIDDDCDGSIDEGGACAGCTTSTYGTSIYQFCQSSRSWPNASSDCQSYGYELVSIQDSAEQSFVADQVAALNGQNVWIGLNDRAVEGTFAWSDGSPVTYTNFSNSSNPNSQDCVELQRPSGDWVVQGCSNGKWFVCESDASCSTPVYADTDGDGYGDPASPLGTVCSTSAGVANALDCDDTQGTIAPDAFEVPGDLIDDDCTGADELFGAVDLAPGDLVITELNANPAVSQGAWVEIYNPFGYAISLSGLQIVDANGTSTVLTSQTLARFDRLVVGGSGASARDVTLPDGADLSQVTLLLDDGSTSVVVDEVVIDGSFTSPTLGQRLVLHPPATDASDNDAGGVWCTRSTGTPGSPNIDCGYGTGALLDPTPPARIDFDYDWTPGTGASFGGTTWFELTVTTPFDPTGATNPGSVSGTFESGNGGDGNWWAAHNEDGPILVLEYPLTGVVYRGVEGPDGYCGGVMRVAMDFAGTWGEPSCPTP